MPGEEGVESPELNAKAIVVVSGLPRSGTSMAMAMLAQGGLACLVDGVRRSDEDNPKGYYELEDVKSLGRSADITWLRRAEGKAVKIVSPLLKGLPEGHSYRVLFMLRDLDEVLASQKKMMMRGGDVHEVPDDEMKRAYQGHLASVDSFLKSRSDISVAYIEHRMVIERSREMAEKIRTFLDLDLDVDRMAAAVDGRLYRNRNA